MLPVAMPVPGLIDEVGKMAEGGQVARVYQGEALVECPFVQLDRLVSSARVGCGVSVALMPLRHPVIAAVHAAALSARSGTRFVLGIGSGAPQTQSALLGAPYPKPLDAVARYVQAVRTGLGQEPVMSAREMPRSSPVPLTMGRAADVEIALGALRPGMARLAGQVADSLVAHAVPPSYVSQVLLPAVRQGVAAAGRQGGIRIAAVVPVGLVDILGGHEALARAHALHMFAPHYRAMYHRAGLLGDTSDPRAAMRELIDAGAVGFGDENDIRGTLHALADSGVHEVILNTSATYLARGPQAAIETMRRVAAHLKREAHRRAPLTGRHKIGAGRAESDTAPPHVGVRG